MSINNSLIMDDIGNSLVQRYPKLYKQIVNIFEQEQIPSRQVHFFLSKKLQQTTGQRQQEITKSQRCIITSLSPLEALLKIPRKKGKMISYQYRDLKREKVIKTPKDAAKKKIQTIFEGEGQNISKSKQVIKYLVGEIQYTPFIDALSNEKRYQQFIKKNLPDAFIFKKFEDFYYYIDGIIFKNDSIYLIDKNGNTIDPGKDVSLLNGSNYIRKQALEILRTGNLVRKMMLRLYNNNKTLCPQEKIGELYKETLQEEISILYQLYIDAQYLDKEQIFETYQKYKTFVTEYNKTHHIQLPTTFKARKRYMPILGITRITKDTKILHNFSRNPGCIQSFIKIMGEKIQSGRGGKKYYIPDTCIGTVQHA